VLGESGIAADARPSKPRLNSVTAASDWVKRQQVPQQADTKPSNFVMGTVITITGASIFRTL
jgi:hypothetical protein